MPISIKLPMTLMHVARSFVYCLLFFCKNGHAPRPCWLTDQHGLRSNSRLKLRIMLGDRVDSANCQFCRPVDRTCDRSKTTKSYHHSRSKKECATSKVIGRFEDASVVSTMLAMLRSPSIASNHRFSV